ncbi:MAG: hypothetical protein NC124_17515 [Clostridium sp.]|nr:hypothetical protein [Clostridium sp.]
METFIEKIDSTKSVFDLVELAYRVLTKEVENQTVFIAEYYSMPSSDNFNMVYLDRLHQSIVELFAEYSFVKYSEHRQQVKNVLRDIQFCMNGRSKKKDLSVIFGLLFAIDCAAFGWDKYRIKSKWGPLDSGDGSYAVYFWGKQSYMEQVKEYIHREQTHESGFLDFIENFRFIKRRGWLVKGEMPEVIVLKPANVKSLQIRIASILPGKRTTIRFVPLKGSTIQVDYREERQKEIADNIILQMKRALEVGVNIIILPEFIVSANTLAQIRKQLYLWRKQGMGNISELVAVFAGSTTDNPRGDNVMNVLDSWGKIIGQYYKYSPYVKKRKDGTGYEQCEYLKNRGKKCPILFVQGVGSFLPAICRDVIDDKYTSALVEIFMPLFLMVSAWSPSVQSFRKHFREFAEKYYTSAVLCNACDAVSNQSQNAPVGLISAIAKPRTTAVGKIYCCRRDNCRKTCEQGCSFIISYDFSIEALREQRNVQIEKQNLVE